MVFYILVLLLAFLIYLLKCRNQECFILGYECFKPSDERMIDTQFSGEIITRNKNLGMDEYKFLLKAIVSSGIGERTYGPRNIFMGREDCPTLADAVSEADDFFHDSIPKLFTKTGVSPKDVDVLVVNISLFASVPSLTSRIVNYYKMREDIKAYNLSGMGCSASLISINLVQSIFKYQKAKYALVVSSESLSPNWYVGNDRSMILSNCLFRSGGSAILLTNDTTQRSRAMFKLKCLVRTHHGSNDESYGCCMQMEDSEGRLGFYLSKNLTKSAKRCMVDNLKELAPKALPIWELVRFVMAVYLCGPKKAKINFKSGIDHFCIHTGGKAVIDGVEENLSLSEYDMEAARMTLHRFGNTSACSLWYVLAYMEAKKRLKRGDKIMMVSFGAGFKCNSCVWEVIRDLYGLDRDNVWRDCIHHYPPTTLANPYLEKFRWVIDDPHGY